MSTVNDPSFNGNHNPPIQTNHGSQATPTKPKSHPLTSDQVDWVRECVDRLGPYYSDFDKWERDFWPWAKGVYKYKYKFQGSDHQLEILGQLVEKHCKAPKSFLFN